MVVGYPAFGNFSDDDIKPRPVIDVYKKMISLRNNGYNELECVASKSDYTSVFDTSFGHKDTFGSKAVDSLVENKLVCPFGLPENSCPEPGNITLGIVPPGAFAYPRYKVSTCLSSEHLEMHVLHNVMHFGSKLSHKKLNYTVPKGVKAKKLADLVHQQEAIEKRGCWFNHKFYPEGGALLDWNSRSTGNSVTAIRFQEKH